MKLEISNKAQTIVNTFSTREKTLFDYLLQLNNNTIEKIVNSTKEIEVYGNENVSKYRAAIKEGTNEQFRLYYIVDCLGIRLTNDYENNKILITV